MTDKQEITLPDPAYEIAMHESFDFPRPIPYLGYDRLPVGTKLYTAEAIHEAVAAERAKNIAALDALNLWDYDDPASSAIAAIQGDQS